MPSAIPTNPKTIARLAEKDDEYAALMEELPPFSYDTSEPKATITFLRGILSQPRRPDNLVREHEIANYRRARNDQSMSLHVFEPATAVGKTLPLVVLFHGGGFTVGCPRNLAEPARSLVTSATDPCIVVAPQYLLAPESPFPAGIVDAYGALDQLTRDFASSDSPQAFSKDILGLLPGNEVELRQEHGGALVVGGVSAGATASCVVGHLARDVHERLVLPITGLYHGCPAPLPIEELVPDRYKARWLARLTDECTKEDPLLPDAVANIFNDSLKPDLKSPLYVPFAWPCPGEKVDIPGDPLGLVTVAKPDAASSAATKEEQSHADLPPTYIQVCGRDRARDDALIYASALLSAGVSARVDIYPGLPHMFWALFNSLAAFETWQADTRAGFAWLFAENDSQEKKQGCSREDDA